MPQSRSGSTTPKGADEFAKIQVQFPVGFSVVVSVAVIILTGIYWAESLPTKNEPQTIRDVLVFFSALSVAGATIAGAFYTARALNATIQADENRALLQRKLYAFEFGKRWNDPQMHYARNTLREIVTHEAGEDDLIRYVDERSTNVIHVLNFLDEIACVLKLDLADHECVKRQFLYVVTSTFRKLSPWIHRHRAARQSADIWVDLENIFDDWKRTTK